MTKHSTRRAIIKGLAATAAAPALSACNSANQTTDDPLFPIWQEWRQTVYREYALYIQLGRIEETLPDLVRHPRVLVMTGKHAGDVWATSPDGIYAVLDPYGTPAERMAKANARIDALTAELERVKAASNAAYAASGYNAACDVLGAICERQGDLEAMIAGDLSASPVSIAAKLDVALSRHAANNPAGLLCDAGPQQVCDAIRALLPMLPAEMQAALAPVAEAEGLTVALYSGEG